VCACQDRAKTVPLPRPPEPHVLLRSPLRDVCLPSLFGRSVSVQ
jgi:hypothetical protein